MPGRLAGQAAVLTPALADNRPGHWPGSATGAIRLPQRVTVDAMTQKSSGVDSRHFDQ